MKTNALNVIVAEILDALRPDTSDEYLVAISNLLQAMLDEGVAEESMATAQGLMPAAIKDRPTSASYQAWLRHNARIAAGYCN